jgi:hypothetical protein
MPNFLQSEHSKRQEQLEDYREFVRTEMEERRHLVEAIRTSGLDYKMAVLDLQGAVNDLNRQVKMLLDDFYKQRVFVENGYMISQNVFYEVDYRERRYLFAFSPVAVVIQTSLGGATINIAANTWTQLSFPKGTRITVPAAPDSAPVMVWIRATDSNIL